MTSIRSQLLLWLVPSFIIIASLAGSSLYLTEKRRLNNILDNELSEFVRIIKLSSRRPPARFARPREIEQRFISNINLKLDDINSGYYLQSWNEDGETLRKSLSLDKQQLNSPPKLAERTENDVTHDSILSSGDEVRVHSFMLRSGPRKGAVHVSVAISLQNINQRLATIAMQLFFGGIFFCSLLAGILILTIRKALVPIQKLSEKVADVEVGSLHNRLIETDVPKEVRPLVTRLNQLLARLEHSFARERQFNNDLAHELRTPLAAIRTTSEVALKWPEQSTADDYQYIAESSAQLQQTIDSLLSLARVESSGAERLSENVIITDALEECIALQTSQAKERKISILRSLDKTQCLQTDPRLLRIIISNLVSNAIAYAPINSEVIISGESNGIILSVENIAPNLDDNDLLAMFDRLWRKDTSRTGIQHVGLGLAIAHTAAEALSLKLIAQLSNQQRLIMSLRLHD